MNNANPNIVSWVNSLENRALREITYLLCSNNLKHPVIKDELHYETFQPVSYLQYGLEFYKSLSVEDLKRLSEINPQAALGRFAERLLAAWFAINPNFEVLAHNLQMIEDHVTLGELDFLVWEKINKRALHLEFALKFYLAHYEGKQVSYIGPKGRDTFERKATKLVEQQLPLIENHPTLLNDQLRQFSFISKILIKGFIFYPIDTADQTHYYLKEKELYKLQKQPSAAFYILKNRRDWIYPFDPLHLSNGLNYSDFENELKQLNPHPTLVVYRRKKGQELGLLMIVDNAWPNLAI